MHRYETRLHRIFQRALANLILMRSLQELNPPAENTELPNEPSPISEQLSAPPAQNTNLQNDLSPHSPIRAPNVREGLCKATQPPPPSENIKLQNEPSPISEQLDAPEPEASEEDLFYAFALHSG
jgi:hypothetical protein